MKALINKFINDESGATAIEYGLISALIAVGCITAMTTLGENLNANFTAIASNIGEANLDAGN